MADEAAGDGMWLSDPDGSLVHEIGAKIVMRLHHFCEGMFTAVFDGLLAIQRLDVAPGRGFHRSWWGDRAGRIRKWTTRTDNGPMTHRIDILHVRPTDSSQVPRVWMGIHTNGNYLRLTIIAGHPSNAYLRHDKGRRCVLWRRPRLNDADRSHTDRSSTTNDFTEVNHLRWIIYFVFQLDEGRWEVYGDHIQLAQRIIWTDRQDRFEIFIEIYRHARSLRESNLNAGKQRGENYHAKENRYGAIHDSPLR